MGGKVLFGNNEDYHVPDTYIWTEPAEEGQLGCLYLGFKDYAHQGGINEKGLCFDANALPAAPLNPHSELPAAPRYPAPFEAYTMWAPVMMLRKAATVEEVIQLAVQYQRENWYPISGGLKYQLNFADATGDGVVISVDESGELFFTRKKPEDRYLISTNFNRANPDNALEYPCVRYEKTQQMLDGLSSDADFTPDFVKNILEAVHQEGLFSRTLYSNIFDLTAGKLYLYHGHQYDEEVVLDIAAELAKEAYVKPIEELFSEGTVNQARQAYRWQIFLLGSQIVGLSLLIFGLVFWRKQRRRKMQASGYKER